MKKTLPLFLVSLVLLFGTFGIAHADLVPCGKAGATACTLGDLFRLAENVYNYILATATSLAGLMIVIGGITILISGGNPNLAGTGKRIIWGAIIGMILIWVAWLVIHAVLWLLGVNPQFIT